MKKIVFSLLFLASCTSKYTTKKVELFNCKTLYQPQNLIIIQDNTNQQEFENITEANIKILIDRNTQLKEVVICQDKQLDLIRK